MELKMYFMLPANRIPSLKIFGNKHGFKYEVLHTLTGTRFTKRRIRNYSHCLQSGILFWLATVRFAQKN